jgi:histidinol-phosphate aminotransferase
MSINKKIFRKEVIQQQACPVENIFCPIKLDANENPYQLPKAVIRRFFKRLQEFPLNRYPDSGSPEVIKRFAGQYGVESNMMIVGNGSDELIMVLCTALGGEGASALVPVPTFAMYRISALNCGHKVITVPLDGSFDLDIPMMLEVIEKQSPSLIFLSYPNNPTGNCFSRSSIEAIIRLSQGLVVVDEAYGNFSGKTFMSDLDKYKNLIILRTLSKVGLAAMRIGFLLGNPEVLHELNKVRLPYNLNALSQMAALLYLDEEPVFLKQIQKIIKKRDYLLRELENIDGVSPYSSEANFIFFSCTHDINVVYSKIIEKGVLVKPFVALDGGLGYMRVTIGTRNENDLFLKALKSTVAEVRSVI